LFYLCALALKQLAKIKVLLILYLSLLSSAKTPFTNGKGFFTHTEMGGLVLEPVKTAHTQSQKLCNILFKCIEYFLRTCVPIQPQLDRWATHFRVTYLSF